MKLQIFKVGFNEREHNIVTTVDIPSDSTIYCDFLDNYMSICTTLKTMCIYVKEIPYRIDIDSHGYVFILNHEFAERHPNPYNLVPSWETHTIYKYDERALANIDEVGCL